MASWISPHKFVNRSKHLAKQQKLQKKKTSLFGNDDDEQSIGLGDNDSIGLGTGGNRMEKMEEEESKFSGIGKWFDLRPEEEQLKSRMKFAASAMDEDEQQQQQKDEEKEENDVEKKRRNNEYALKLVAEMLRAATEVFNARVKEKEQEKRSQDGGFSFEDEIIRSGTSADKIAALSLMVARDPAHNITKLDQVLKFCSSSNGNVAALAVRTVKDLLLNNLLPTGDRSRNEGARFPLQLFRERDLTTLYNAIMIEQRQKGIDTTGSGVGGKHQMRKRVVFNKDGTKTEEVTEIVPEVQPIDVASLSPLHERFLYFWYLEDLIKRRMTHFIELLVERTKTATPALQIRAVLDLRDMLRGTTNECQDRVTILKAIINKLKDQTVAVASRSMRYMISILNPILSAEDSSYNPFHVRDLDRIFVVREVAQILYNPDLPANAKLYAATLLNRIELLERVDRDLARYLISCYLKTCDIHFRQKESTASTMRAVLTGIHRAVPIAEVKVEDYRDALETIFIVARISQFNNAVEALRVIWMFLGQSIETKSASRFYAILYDKLFDKGIRQHSTKRSAFLSLLFRAMRDDTNVSRQKAFCKRLLQSAFMGSTEYACSCILLLKNLFTYHPQLKDMFERPESLLRPKISGGEVFSKKSKRKKSGIDEQEEEEVEEDTDAIQMRDTNNSETDATTGNSAPQSRGSNPGGSGDNNAVMYDPTRASPLHANADLVALYELLPFMRHFHPSGRYFTERTVRNKRISNFEGNPMEDFTTVRFLDKFMYRKVKSKMKLDPIKHKYTVTSDAVWQGQMDPLPLRADSKTELPSKSVVPIDDLFRYKFLEKQRAAAQMREMSIRVKQTEKMKAIADFRTAAIEESDRRIEEELAATSDYDDNDDNMSVFSYSDLDRVLQNDVLDDDDVEQLLLEQDEMDDDFSDDYDDEDEEGAGSKKKQKASGDRFGYDITGSREEGPDEDEMAMLFEEDEDALFQEAKQLDKADKRFDHESGKRSGQQADGKKKMKQKRKRDDGSRKAPKKGKVRQGGQPAKKKRRTKSRK